MVLKCYRDWKISLSLHGWLKNMTSYSHFKLKKNMKDNWCTLLIASNIHKVSKECISTFSQPGLFLEKHIVSQRRRGKKRPSKPIRSVCMEMKGAEKEHIQICWQSCQGSGLLKYYCCSLPTHHSSQWHHLHDIVEPTGFDVNMYLS